MATSVTRIVRPEGMKTIYIDAVVDTSACRFREVQITGDFFVYPPEALEHLEEELRGCNTIDCIHSKINSVAATTEVLGLDYNALKEALTKILSDVCSKTV